MFKRIEYSNNNQITAKVTEDNTNSVWVAFAQDTSGNCILQRQSAYDPEQNFFTLSRSIDEIVDIYFYSGSIYVAYNDTTLIGEIIDVNNPLTVTQTLTKPVGITEQPVGITANSNGVFILMPGTSPNDIDVVVFDLSGTFDETVVVTGINNGFTITSDNNNETWATTNNSPSELIRIFPDGGGSFNTQITILS